MKALYAGSFDPFTIGHLAIARQALELFGDLVIGVGINDSKINNTSQNDRVESIRKLFDKDSRVTVEAYEGLTVDFARLKNIGVLVRGVRNSIDFEKEKELAEINTELSGIPTVLLVPPPEYSFISSSMVRELERNGYDASKYLAGSNLNKENK